MSRKWWKPKNDPLKNKYVHELESSIDSIDEETDERETDFEELDGSSKKSVLYSFLEIGETLKAIENEDELNTEELPVDTSRKWRSLRNRIAHDPVEVQNNHEYVQEHIDDLEELDEQIDDYWLENVEDEDYVEEDDYEWEEED